MATLPIDKVQPGMTVSDKVVNDKGMAILQPGTVLSEALIARLKKWGVQQIPVEGAGAASQSAAKTDDTEPRISTEDQVNRLKERFAPVMQDAIMQQVFEGIRTFIANDAAAEKENPDT